MLPACAGARCRGESLLILVLPLPGTAPGHWSRLPLL